MCWRQLTVGFGTLLQSVTLFATVTVSPLSHVFSIYNLSENTPRTTSNVAMTVSDTTSPNYQVSTLVSATDEFGAVAVQSESPLYTIPYHLLWRCSGYGAMLLSPTGIDHEPKLSGSLPIAYCANIELYATVDPEEVRQVMAGSYHASFTLHVQDVSDPSAKSETFSGELDFAVDSHIYVPPIAPIAFSTISSAAIAGAPESKVVSPFNVTTNLPTGSLYITAQPFGTNKFEMRNPAGDGIDYGVKFTPCGGTQKTLLANEPQGFPVTEATNAACQAHPGQLTFTRNAVNYSQITTGTYTGTLYLMVSDTE